MEFPEDGAPQELPKINQNLPHEIGNPGVSGIPILEQPMRRSVALPGLSLLRAKGKIRGTFVHPVPGL